MSKELEALDKLNTMFLAWAPKYIKEDKKLNEDLFECIKSALKTLEIIKKKGCSYIEMALIVSCGNYEKYCFEMSSGRVYLSGYECQRAFKTQEEYDLLNEVLK